MAATAAAAVVDTPGPPAGGLALRLYQEAALTAIEQAAHRGVRRPLIVLPTGTGGHNWPGGTGTKSSTRGCRHALDGRAAPPDDQGEQPTSQ